MNARIPQIKIAAIVSLMCLFSAVGLRAQNGTWTNTLAGTWSDPTSWLDGTVAQGPGSTAFFNTLDVPSNATITVSADYGNTTSFPAITNANLFFGDTDVSSNSVGNWSVTEGGLGITLDSTTPTNSTIDVTLATGADDNLVAGWGTATISADLHGANTLVKTGPSPLILTPSTANDYTGGTVVSNGMIQVGGNLNNVAFGTGPIIFYGGSVRLWESRIPGAGTHVDTGQNGLPNDIIVPSGQSGTLWLTPYARPCLSGPVSGGGDLHLMVDYVRDELRNDWSGFTGHLFVAPTTRGNSDFRIGANFNPAGLANTTLIFTNNPLTSAYVNMYNAGLPATNFDIGAMVDTVPGAVSIASHNTGPGTKNSAPMILAVGGLNTDAEFAGNFSGDSGGGSISIVKVGTGTWILDGPAVAYSGMTVVSNGVLQIGKDTSGTLGYTPVVTNYATLAFGRSDDMTVTNVIDGTGTVEQVGTGMLTLAPAAGGNNYTGKTVVKSGSLTVTSQAAFGLSPASFTADQLALDGGAFVATTNFSLDDANRGIALGASGGTLGATAGSTLTVASIVGGSGNLMIDSPGNVSLTGANTYTGGTILTSGTLMLASEAPLGAAPGAPDAFHLTLNGGTLESTATFAIDDANRGVTVASIGGTIRPDSGTTLTIAEPTSGDGALTKAGDGALVINGADTRTGNTLINAGTLAVGASGSISASPVISVASGATFDVSAGGYTLGTGQSLTGSGTIAGNFTAGSGSTISAGDSVAALAFQNDVTLNGATNWVEISSSTNDMLNVAGQLTLQGVNTMRVQLLEPLPNGNYPLVKYGTISGTEANLALAGYPLSRRTATLVIDSANHSIDLSISGSVGTLMWTGGSNGNAWDVNSTANWLNGATHDVFFNGDDVTFDDTGASNPVVNITQTVQPGVVTVNSTAGYTFSGPGYVSGAAALAKSGPGTLTVLTTNDFIGGTTISAGTVQVGNGTVAGSLGSGNIADNAVLSFNLPGALNVDNAINGTGSLAVQAGAAVLTADNSYGDSSVSSGATLQAGNGGATGSLGTGAVSNDGALIYNRGGVVTNAGAIRGAGSLTVQGGGTVVLASDNAYSGDTLVDVGTLQVGAGGAAGTLGSASSVTVNAGGTLAFNRSHVTTNSVAVTGAGALRQEGAGTLVLISSNSYGATLIDAGATLQVGNGDSNLYYTVLTTNIDTVNMVTNVVTNFFGSVALGTGDISDDGTLVPAQAYPWTLTNTISGAGSVAQMGAGTLTIQRTTGNAYAGGTIISNASVILAPPAGLARAEEGSAVTELNQNGLGTGPIAFLGTNSTLQLAWADQQDPNSGISPNFAYTIDVPAGQSGTLWAQGRYDDNSVLTGSGTYNIGVNYVRDNFRGDWSGFTGQLNIITNAVRTQGTSTAYDFRDFNANGLPNAKVYIGPGADIQWQGSGSPFVPLGELTGDPTSFVTSGNWTVGGLNTDATFDGAINGGSIVKVGTGKWTLTGANTSFSGAMVVSNGVLAFGVSPVDGTTVGSIASVPSITVAAPGEIDASGYADDTFHVGDASPQTLQGNGTIQGGASIGVVGVLAPGFGGNGFGNLTVTGNLAVDGAATLYIGDTGAPANSSVTALQTTIGSTATLTVTQVGTNDLPTGDTFKLFNGPVTGTFASVSLPQYNAAATITYVWTNMIAINGSIKLLSGGTNRVVNTSPTSITPIFSGNQLTLQWPQDHTGWRLQVQTNSLSTGLTTNWVDVANSTGTNQMTFTISPTNDAVFYRMVYP